MARFNRVVLDGKQILREGSAMQRVWRTVTGFYHVCARGTGKQLIFESDDDR